jgi:hypothetical protein
MMEMHGYFEELRQAIEPDPRRKREAQKADDPVREHLATHWSYASRHLATFLYGSYRRSTAVGDIKDVDIVVVTNHTKSDRPVAVLDGLKTSLGYLYPAPDLADQRRSIRIDRPLPDVPGASLTLDIVPAIYSGGVDDFLWIPDRDKATWVASHPKGHLQYTSYLNSQSYQERAFVRLTKMLKWWWKYQFERRWPGVPAHERKPKGFWIEVMTGQYADLTKASYPELIISVLERSLRAFQGFRSDGRVPPLPDPGLPTEKIATSMSAQDFAVFLGVMEESLAWARAAWTASSEERAREYWDQFFGDERDLAKANGASGGLLSPAATVGGLRFPDKPVVPRKPGGFA